MNDVLRVCIIKNWIEQTLNIDDVEVSMNLKDILKKIKCNDLKGVVFVEMMKNVDELVDGCKINKPLINNELKLLKRVMKTEKEKDFIYVIITDDTNCYMNQYDVLYETWE